MSAGDHHEGDDELLDQVVADVVAVPLALVGDGGWRPGRAQADSPPLAAPVSALTAVRAGYGGTTP